MKRWLQGWDYAVVAKIYFKAEIRQAEVVEESNDQMTPSLSIDECGLLRSYNENNQDKQKSPNNFRHAISDQV